MKKISLSEASEVASKLGVEFKDFSVEDFCVGVNVELEHGSRDSETDVTHDDLLLTGKIAWAHLKEFPDYYERLEKMEDEAKLFWNK